jgi:hypothetical protein
MGRIVVVEWGPERPVGVADGPLKGQRDAAPLGKSRGSEGDCSVFFVSKEGVVSVVVVVDSDSRGFRGFHSSSSCSCSWS